MGQHHCQPWPSPQLVVQSGDSPQGWLAANAFEHVNLVQSEIWWMSWGSNCKWQAAVSQRPSYLSVKLQRWKHIPSPTITTALAKPQLTVPQEGEREKGKRECVCVCVWMYCSLFDTLFSHGNGNAYHPKAKQCRGQHQHLLLFIAWIWSSTWS